jgi:hypothetical protein
MNKLIVLKPDGTETIEERDDPLTLEEAQKLVGGYVERVPFFMKYKGEPCVALCDEEGKLKGYETNYKATVEWWKTAGVVGGDHLVGDIVILVGKRLYSSWR